MVGLKYEHTLSLMGRWSVAQALWSMVCNTQPILFLLYLIFAVLYASVYGYGVVLFVRS